MFRSPDSVIPDRNAAIPESTCHPDRNRSSQSDDLRSGGSHLLRAGRRCADGEDRPQDNDRQNATGRDAETLLSHGEYLRFKNPNNRSHTSGSTKQCRNSPPTPKACQYTKESTRRLVRYTGFAPPTRSRTLRFPVREPSSASVHLPLDFIPQARYNNQKISYLQDNSVL